MARFETLHRRLAVHRAAQGAARSRSPRSPRPTTSTSWSTTSSRSCGSPPRASATTRRSSAACRLDIVGLPPTVDEYNRFMTSTDPDKRAKWIDELLERKEFSEIWVYQVGRAAPDPHRPDHERQPEGDVPLLQLAGRQALEEHADGRDGPGAARAPAAARSRTRRPTSTRSPTKRCR